MISMIMIIISVMIGNDWLNIDSAVSVKTERVPPLQPKIWRKIQTIGRVQTLETSAFRMFSCLFKSPDRGTLALLGSLQQK